MVIKAKLSYTFLNGLVKGEIMTKIKSKFTETSGSTSVVESQLSAMNLAIADTREGLDQKAQDDFVTLAVHILKTPELQSEKAASAVFAQASRKTVNWENMDEETLVANALNPDGFPTDVLDLIIQDPTGYLHGQKTAFQEDLKTELMKVTSQDPQMLSVSKINQLLDKSGASSDPILVQELKQKIAKKSGMKISDLNLGLKNGQSKPSSQMGSGRL